ncbi:MAG TPA: double-strand break repair protein AddB [Alphaproteobacteria bacterium]
MSAGPRLYTIAPGVPFVDALARGMMARIAGEAPGDPLALARATVLLPTRRAVRSLREAFLRAGDGRPLLLPRMRPLGDLDEDEILIAGEPAVDTTADAGAGADLPPALGGLRRQLLLARCVLAFGGRRREGPPDAAQAAALAAELARLLDQMETERVRLDALHRLTPEDANLAAHWRDVLAFLEILMGDWPRVLAEEGAVGPAERRDLLLAAQARLWADRPPAGWVIAAGSTGSIPATADLLAAVARLPRGCVVLPGLDRDLPDDAWVALAEGHEGHAQFGLARLLARLGVGREAVRDWGADWPGAEGAADGAMPARARLASAALSPRPAPPPADAEAALDGLAWVDCPSPAEEAAVIALMMREALETAGRTAALVTPDRGLARRVAARLRRWGVEVDDSAGVPLAATPVAAFLLHLADMAAANLAPVPLLACLKHPLAAGGEDTARFRRRVRALERHALRGPRPAPGLGGLAGRLVIARGEAEARGHREAAAEIEALIAWLPGLGARVMPFLRAMEAGRAPLARLLAAHGEAAEALAATDGETGGERLWRGDDGEAMAGFMADLGEAARGFPEIETRRYPALVESLLAGRVVRPRYGRHPRLAIWGPLEARLQQADLIILGGLNEGTWPPDAGSDPWLSRPMRAAIGLPLPERRIGLAAHDFCQAFSAPAVALTRAHRVGGAPTVPSRWLLRIANLLPEAAMARLREEGARWRARAAALERPAAAEMVEPRRPRPAPPVAARPRKLSVTEIETWQTNPYAIYARHVLGLAPLDPLDAEPGAAERGVFIHRALERFVRAYPDALPAGGPEAVAAALIAIGREAFAPVRAMPGLHAFWWPRFERIARWVAQAEIERRAMAKPILAEARGMLALDGPAGPFTLVGRADRVDRLADGGLAIIDYKSGTLPARSEQEAGFAPQLPLLAAMAAAGALDGVATAPVGELAFWRLTGGEPPGEAKPYAVEPGAAAEAALAGLGALIALYDRDSTPYPAHAVPDLVRFDDYAHLARVQEWASPEGGAEG